MSHNETEDQYKARIEAAQKSHDSASEHFEALNKFSMDAGVVAVRSLFLINGGAAIAVLAFIAQVYDGDSHLTVADVANALLWFAVGVAFAALAACGTYLTNFSYSSASASRTQTWEHPFSEETRSSVFWLRAGYGFHILTILTALAALATFLIGVYQLAGILQNTAT